MGVHKLPLFCVIEIIVALLMLGILIILLITGEMRVTIGRRDKFVNNFVDSKPISVYQK